MTAPPVIDSDAPRVDLAQLPNLPHVTQWILAADEARDHASKPVSHTHDLAAQKARQYVDLGTAYADYQPGNGTAYMVVLHDLARSQIDVAVRNRVAAAPRPDREYREYVQRTGLGPSARLGGELLVALPQNRGGVCSVFSCEHALHLPYYINEKLRLGPGDAPYVAAFITLFCDSVTLLRAGGTA